MENLAQLEALCERLYKSQDSAERAYAENTLRSFSQDTDCMPKLEYILENARNQYAVLFASSSLLKHVTDNSLPLQQRLQIRNLAINCLASRSADLEHFVISSLIQLVCRLTKIGWLDDDKFKELISDSMNFLNQQEATHYAIGLKLLHHLVGEMNQPTPGMLSMQHRRVSIKFKEQALLQIYGISLTSLFALKNDGQQKLWELALSLSLQCLSFDFLGMSADESSDEVGATQIPVAWKSVIEEPSTAQIYFDYYAVSSPPLSKLALECLGLLVSVKYSLFTNKGTRRKFLTSLMMGTMDILETGKGLNHHDNYHEFCRLLGCFKVHFQLSDLVSLEGYNGWISLVSDFTLKSLQSWKWTSGSIYYLLGLWSRMLTSLPFMKDSSLNSRLDEFVPKILEGFISSRFNSLEADDLSEDPLDNVELMQDQLDSFPYLCRFQYGSCSAYITSIMDPILQEYMEGAKLQDYATSGNVAAVETKLAWMVHIVGAIMSIKQYSGGEPNEVIDAELSARVLQLVNVMDTGSYVQRYGELSRQRLELAVLSFFQNFRKTYIGDQTMHSSKQFYVRLSELLGLHDQLLILDVIIRKLATNLKFCTKEEKVLDQTLSLLKDMAIGHMSGKSPLKQSIDSLNYITSNHNREHFIFLKDYNARNRTTFYYFIGSLVFVEDSIVKFKQLMEPFLQIFVNLESIPEPMFRDETVKCALVGLMRDLRGIAMATNSRRTYRFLFDWLYPAHMPLLVKAIASWGDSPEVTTSLLKFIAELVCNKAQRLVFDQSSPNGILLFREASKLLVAYGSKFLNLPDQKDVYRSKYKGMWISLTILSRAIAGNYVNFGVFELYGDRALDDALAIALKMILSVPAADILAYRKVCSAYFSFVEIIFGKLIRVTFNLDVTTFIYIVKSLESGLKVSNSEVISQCANAIDHMATFYFNHIIMGESPATPALLRFAQHISDCADVFLDILKTILEMILFEDSPSQWGLSRPLLSLILLSEELFTKFKTKIVASQPVDQQQRVLHCFDILMEGVTRDLDASNRDRFTRNISKFRKEFRGK